MKIEQSLTFPFKAPDAGKKLAVGGLFSLLFFTVFFPIVVSGYMMHILYDALEGRNTKLPDWTNLRKLFNEGLMPVLIVLAYLSPLIMLLILEQVIYTFGGDLFGLVESFFFLRSIIAIGLSLILPVALIRFAVIRSFKAAFNLGQVLKLILTNPGSFFTAWSLSVAVWAICVLGFLVFIVGFFFTYFIANIIVVHLFAQAYRASNPFDDDKDGKLRSSMAIPPPLH